MEYWKGVLVKDQCMILGCKRFDESRGIYFCTIVQLILLLKSTEDIGKIKQKWLFEPLARQSS